MAKIPRTAATRVGTVTVLGDTGDLVADILDAIDTAGGPETLDRRTVQAILDQNAETAGLRAEAGYRTPNITIFHTHTEVLATGKRAAAWLTMSRTPAGDAVYWNVAIVDTAETTVISLADRRLADELLKMLRQGAGGPSTGLTECTATFST